MRLLFIQLPLLDNDPRGHSENERLAAAYLRHSLRRAGLAAETRCAVLPRESDALDNAGLLALLLAAQPDLVAATLYAWNVERTLRLLAELKRHRPAVRVAVGGPEVAPRHPFLFRSRAVDVAVAGEGEPVFPAIVRALRGGGRTDFRNVAWRAGAGFRWGAAPPPVLPLAQMLPPPGDPWLQPDRAGVAYVEATRGCPLRCAFCCYDQRRHALATLPVRRVLARVRRLLAAGARDIRFVDPSFNAHPQFEDVVRGLAALNPRRHARFFAELLAERVTPAQAALLAAAHFTDVEVGVQSANPAVLRAIRRPAHAPALRRGIRRLAGRGVRLTLDAMCGLPGQTLDDVKTTLRRLAGVPRARVQLLHTLLLPGTELRRRRRALGLVAADRPPYRVETTPALCSDDMLAADRFADRLLGRRMDSPAARFVGRGLPDLFAERVTLRPHDGIPACLPGRTSRRALILAADDPYAAREWAKAAMRRAIRTEPDALWQFVLQPAGEVPLDLFEELAAVVDGFTPHFADRLKPRRAGEHRVARRVFVRLTRRARVSRGWFAAAENLLERLFY